MAAISFKEEDYAAVEAILLDPKWKTPRDMTKAVVKACYERFRLRSWWALGIFRKGVPMQLYGLEPTEHAAISASDMPYRDMAAVEVKSMDAYKRDLEASLQDAEIVPNPVCQRAGCGHQLWAHQYFTAKGQRTSALKGAPKCSAGCDCTGFLAEPEDIPAD